LQVAEEVDEGEAIKHRISQVSFGSLAKTLDITGEGVSRKRKRGSEKSEEAEAKLDALRKRLRELRASKELAPEQTKDSKVEKVKKSSDRKATAKGSGSGSEVSEDDHDGSDDQTSDEESTAKKGRSSKHAPTSMSSKRAVTRRRTVVPIAKSKIRDPRFDPLTGPLVQTDIDKKYSFLNDYRTTEITALRTAIKNPKISEHEQEALKRQLLSMQSKQKAKAKEDAERKVLSEHRKKEKDMIKQGKQPFYLKKSEQKKQALVERFSGMKAKERERVIERRRKKLSSREKRNMPDARRA
jgi:ribosomal RNA-processing protein 36